MESWGWASASPDVGFPIPNVGFARETRHQVSLRNQWITYKMSEMSGFLHQESAKETIFFLFSPERRPGRRRTPSAGPPRKKRVYSRTSVYLPDKPDISDIFSSKSLIRRVL
jgi:hypothetical protein